MRVTPSFLLLLAVALGAASCAGQPASWSSALPPARMQVAAPPPAPGIDTFVYGSAEVAAAPQASGPGAAIQRGLFMAAADPLPASAPAPADQRRLFMAAAPPSTSTPAPAEQRGLFTAAADPPPATHAAAQPRSAPLKTTAYAPAAEHRAYTLDSGDRLRIVVFGQDGLSNSYVVDASGYIDMPLIGPVAARGATSDELSGRISEKLRQGYVKEPHVAVEIEAYRPFFILGEVTQPGQYPYVADMTVETAVAIAGGFGPRASRQTVTVTRTVRGEQVRMTVPPSFPLRPGDTVNVQERWF
jgi:protein involved in polysaccharide export with SLBB domain